MPSNGNEYWIICDSSLNDSLGEALISGVIGVNHRIRHRSQSIQSQADFLNGRIMSIHDLLIHPLLPRPAQFEPAFARGGDDHAGDGAQFQ